MSSTFYYSYDASQRMTLRHSESFVDTTKREASYFNYNQRDQVTRLANEKGASPDALRTFTYNGLGNLVYGQDGTATPSYFAWDGGRMVLENYAGNSTRVRWGRAGQHFESVSPDLTRANPVQEQWERVGKLVGPATNQYFYSVSGEREAATQPLGSTIPTQNRIQGGPDQSFLRLTTTNESYTDPDGRVSLTAQNVFACGNEDYIPNPPILASGFGPITRGGEVYPDPRTSLSRQFGPPWGAPTHDVPWQVVLGRDTPEFRRGVRGPFGLVVRKGRILRETYFMPKGSTCKPVAMFTVGAFGHPFGGRTSVNEPALGPARYKPVSNGVAGIGISYGFEVHTLLSADSDDWQKCRYRQLMRGAFGVQKAESDWTYTRVGSPPGKEGLPQAEAVLKSHPDTGERYGEGFVRDVDFDFTGGGHVYPSDEYRSNIRAIGPFEVAWHDSPRIEDVAVNLSIDLDFIGEVLGTDGVWMRLRYNVSGDYSGRRIMLQPGAGTGIGRHR